MANLGRISEDVGMEGVMRKLKMQGYLWGGPWNREAITYFLIGVP